MNYRYCGYYYYVDYTEFECLLSGSRRQNPLAPPLTWVGDYVVLFLRKMEIYMISAVNPHNNIIPLEYV
jgi:hypothetical protein